MKTKLHFSNSAQKSLIVFILFIFSLSVFSQNEFITTWQTDNPGTSNDMSITIPTKGTGYSYDVDWTYDGGTFNSEDSGVTGNITHDYGAVGIYTVAIRGTFPRIYLYQGGDKLKIMSIEQWGTNPWASMKDAFYSCKFLVSNAADTPNLSGVLDASDMFWNANAFNADLTNWDVSNVTNMDYMLGITAVTGDLSSWDVSNVGDMSYMFSGATAFNQDLGSWDISSASSMTDMFAGVTLSTPITIIPLLVGLPIPVEHWAMG